MLISRVLSLSAALLLGTVSLTALSAPNSPNAADNTPQGLAVGQNPKLLQMTRDANAGAGNGGEFVKVKGSFSVIGCNPHDMSSCFSTKYVEIDPGNSQTHNQSPECDIFQCEFTPGN